MSGRLAIPSSALLQPSIPQRVGRVALIMVALLFLAGFLVLPVAAVFHSGVFARLEDVSRLDSPGGCAFCVAPHRLGGLHLGSTQYALWHQPPVGRLPASSFMARAC
jgi:hypothetical protein